MKTSYTYQVEYRKIPKGHKFIVLTEPIIEARKTGEWSCKYDELIDIKYVNAKGETIRTGKTIVTNRRYCAFNEICLVTKRTMNKIIKGLK